MSRTHKDVPDFKPVHLATGFVASALGIKRDGTTDNSHNSKLARSTFYVSTDRLEQLQGMRADRS